MRRWCGSSARLVAIGAVVMSLAFASLAPTTAHAQEVPSRRMGVKWEGSTPRLTFSARDIVNADVRRKLESGLPKTLQMTIYAYRKGRGKPVSVSARSCRVTYDLWEELFRLQIQTPDSDRSERVGELSEVLERCVVARNLEVGGATDYEGLSDQEVYFAVLVEFEPMSPEAVQRIRRWLARPAGGGGFEGDAFFGSFVSLFVNRRIGDAERVIRFRSQAIEVP